VLLVAIPSVAERFLAGNPSFWTDRFQYSLPIAPILAFAAIDSLSRLRGARVRGLAVAGVLACGLVLSAAVVRPLRGLSDYMPAGRAAAIDSCLDRIPPRAAVAASDSLVPHLTHRLRIDPLSRQEHDRYLAVDGRATHSPGYRRVCRRGGVTVLRARA
jgi:hypothetical protein